MYSFCVILLILNVRIFRDVYNCDSYNWSDRLYKNRLLYLTYQLYLHRTYLQYACIQYKRGKQRKQ